MKKIKLSLILTILVVQSVMGKEVIQSFKVSNKNKNLAKITELYEVKSQVQNNLIIYVLKEEVQNFKKLAPTAQLLEKDINSSIRFQKSLKGYHSFDQVKEIYNNFAKDYPSIAKIIPYGESKNKRELFALKISDNVDLDESEPKLMITSATHGDELITVEVQLELVKELLEGAKTKPMLKKMIDDHELYFIPVVNPDGFSRRSRYAGRHDPNRQYPGPDKPGRVTKVDCIKNLMNFYNKHNFQGSIDIHASGEMVMFPWAHTNDEINSADFNMMDKLTTEMAKVNGYKHGPISKVIYVAKGSSVDYYYWQNSGVALAFELTTSKYPSASKIPQVVDETR
jgi:carboxypeptidase T